MAFYWGTLNPWTPSVDIKDCLPRRLAFLHAGVGCGDFAELIGTPVVNGDVVVGSLPRQVEEPTGKKTPDQQREAKSRQVEHLAQRSAHRTCVRVSRHHVRHLLPPCLADVCRGDGRPLFFALDFGVAEELARFLVQEDRVVRDAVVFEHLLQLWPDRIVALFVFLFGAGIDRHYKSFADFYSWQVFRDNTSRVYST